MRRALSWLRPAPVYRAARFAAGLQAAGFKVVHDLPDPRPGDALLIWNRYGHYDLEAKRFERAGASVLVAENSYLAGEIPGRWHALALWHHAGAGTWLPNGPERWDALRVELKPWRTSGEVLIISQRSIGEPGIASPLGWEQAIQKQVGGRIRPHPGKNPPAVSLEADLAAARCVVTWASSAALVALLYGVPVFHAMPRWIGAEASKPLSEWGSESKRDDAARLAMFRRLIWAQWRIEEIESGDAFRHLLG